MSDDVEPLSKEEMDEIRASVAQGILPPGLNVLRLLATIDQRDAEIARLNAELARFERFGTYLDPAAYGNDYDHHTLTNMETMEGRCVALYRRRPLDHNRTEGGDVDGS